MRLETLDSPHRSPVHPIVGYVRQAQRGLLLATVLRASTNVVICSIRYRLATR